MNTDETQMKAGEPPRAEAAWKRFCAGEIPPQGLRDELRQLEREGDVLKIEHEKLTDAFNQCANSVVNVCCTFPNAGQYIKQVEAARDQLRAERDAAMQGCLWERAKGGILADAAREHLREYLFLVNSGDAGNWDPEADPHVIALRAALKPFDRAAAPLLLLNPPREEERKGEV